MKVLITGCSKETYWYEGMIGEIFECTKESDVMDAYVCSNDKLVIFKKDCHVIQSIVTVLTEWEKSGGELQLWSFYLEEWVELIKEDGVKLGDILRIKPIETSQYRPYTFEEAKEVFTKQAWVKSKVSGYLALVTLIGEDFVSVSDLKQTYQELLEKATHLDGTPCGVKIN